MEIATSPVRLFYQAVRFLLLDLAYAAKPGYVSSNIDIQTYVFLSDLVTWRAVEAIFLDQSERIGSTAIMCWGNPMEGNDCQFSRLAVTLDE